MSTSLDSLGPLADAVRDQLAAFARDETLPRLWQGDLTLWRDDVDAHGARARLGWLHLPETARGAVEDCERVASELRDGGYRHAVLLGSGGASLTAELLRKALGVAPGHLDLHVLDSTIPDAVRHVEASMPIARTAFVLASESEPTLEAEALRRHFAESARPEQFIALTDARSPVEELAREEGFGHVLTSPHDVGERFSSLSCLGLFPGALLGVDVDALLESACDMADRCAAQVAPRDNPAAVLGATLARAALAGRDKLTLVLPPPLAALGPWIEKLVAESTGKQDTGILPVDGEPLGRPEIHGDDRVFVHVRLGAAEDGAQAERVAGLAAAGHPVLECHLDALSDLGGELFRWQLATALACSVLGVDPFETPDVGLADELAARALEEHARTGTLPVREPVTDDQGALVHVDPELQSEVDSPRLADWLEAHLRRGRPGDHVAFLPYLHATDRLSYAVTELRTAVRDRLGLATTVGLGPRYLRATARHHLGGADRGLFVILTRESEQDVPVAGSRSGFDAISRAQAIGSFDALLQRGRRVVMLHITRRWTQGLTGLRSVAEQALRRLP